MKMSKGLYIGSLLGLPPTLVFAASAEIFGIVAMYVLYLVGLHCHFWYTAWSAIQDGHARMTPGQAVGRAFIPLYNIYWAFNMVGGFPEDYNAYLDRHGLQSPKLKSGPFEVMPVLILCSVIPIVGAVAALANVTILVPMIVSRTCNAVNALNLPTVSVVSAANVSESA